MEVFLYDSFSNHIFGGNIAGVLINNNAMDSSIMQKIASEINAPTTGFIAVENETDISVKFFTATQEIDMCGHVVLAVFTALVDEGVIKPTKVPKIYNQWTNSGNIKVSVSQEANKLRVLMFQNSPIDECVGLSIEDLAVNLGIQVSDITSDYPVKIVSTALRHLIIPLNNLKVIQSLKPDYTSLAKLSQMLNVDTICPFTTHTIKKDSQVHCRDLCPGIGNLEESASGTTNGALSSYLVMNEVLKKLTDGKINIRSEQGFEMGRPSIINSEIIVKEGKIVQVGVGGNAVRSLKGTLLI